MENFKYKIVITEGCTAFGTEINNRNIIDIPKEEMDEIIDYLLVKVKESYNQSGTNFEEIVRLLQPDDWEHDPNVCEQCGDAVSSTTWNI